MLLFIIKKARCVLKFGREAFIHGKEENAFYLQSEGR